MIRLPDLPICQALPALHEALRSHRNVLLEAPPGAGKSTVVPLALLEADWRGSERVLVLEPRRIAARAIAQRMATLLGESVGQTVGFRTRLETRVGVDTIVEVVTEGILTRMLQRDPALEGVACVVFDEFHERNLQGDLGLALCLDTQRHLRESLRLLVMSATLDGESLLRLLGDAAVVRSSGRMFDVETHYLPPRRDSRNGARIEVRVTAATLHALREHEGDALVFLPGAAEIRRVVASLAESLAQERCSALPLYGNLPASDQDAVLRPDPQGRRRVVVATNIAETSLTIENVRIVVDAGVERRQRFDPATGMSALETLRISRASADQRRGRAGRTAPGVCYRLWSESAQDALLPQAPAEIVEADLAPLALELAGWGCDDPTSLAWLDPPPPATLAQARELLTSLEALDPSGRITSLGRDMAALGLHPRLGHMVLRGQGIGLGTLACEIAALLTERDPLRAAPGAREPDLQVRIDALHDGPAPIGAQFDDGAVRRIRRVAQQIARQVARLGRAAPARDSWAGSTDAAGLLLAYAYPDRIGRAREGGRGRYLLSGGRGAVVDAASVLARSEFIVVASLDAGERDASVHLAASLDPRELERHFASAIEDRASITWDVRSEAVAARRLRKLGAVALSDEPLRDADPAAVRAAMLAGIRALGLGCLPWSADLEQWRARVALVRDHDPQATGGWPDVSDAALLGSLESWLAPWLDGVTRRAQLAKVDLRGALHGLLGWSLRRRLDELAPTQLTVPSGSRVVLDYTEGAPTLAVRLQELFGLTESPRVVQGRVPVTLVLLSPARRPVQVTRDLASFWERGYHEVRKELRGRYPKHYWPDDPREAIATRRVRGPDRH